jgi:hypothetical protein
MSLREGVCLQFPLLNRAALTENAPGEIIVACVSFICLFMNSIGFFIDEPRLLSRYGDDLREGRPEFSAGFTQLPIRWILKLISLGLRRLGR